MKIATNTIEITPPMAVYLAGYNSPERQVPAKGIHDDIYATAMLLEIEQKQLLLISLDVVVIVDEKAAIFRKQVSEATGLPLDAVIVNTLHTHSSANGFDDIPPQSENPAYFEFVLKQVLKLLSDLPTKLEVVQPYLGSTMIDGYYTNRNNASYFCDKKASVIKFINADDRLVAALLSMNVHSTVLGPQNQLLSSDLVGGIRNKFRDELGVTPYLAIGDAADASTRMVRQGNDFEELARVVDGIWQQIRQINNYLPLTLDRLEIKPISYHLSYDNHQYLDYYQQLLRKTEHKLAQSNLSFDEHKILVSERDLITSYRLVDGQIDIEIKMNVIKLGQDLEVATFPGELVSIFGRDLQQKRQANHLLLICYANGYDGYFVEKDKYGKYFESYISKAPKGVAEKIVEKLGDAL